MAAAPRYNLPLWEVLREGPGSPYARWFDIDWAAGGGKVLLPVLAGRVGEESDAFEQGTRDDGTPVLRHGDLEFRSARARRASHCPSCWPRSTTGSPGGGWPGPS